MRLIVIVILVVLSALAIWSIPSWSVTTAETTFLLQDGRKFAPYQIQFLVTKLAEHGITDVVEHQGTLKLPRKYRSQCTQIVESSEFCQLEDASAPSQAAFSNPFISPSEKQRLAKQQKIEQLQDILKRISGIRDAAVVHHEKKTGDFSRAEMQTGSITLWAEEGKVIGRLQATTARRILCSAFAGLDEAEVPVVDGDTGMTFTHDADQDHSQPNAIHQLDLDSTRHQIEVQTRKLLTKFGQPELEVLMKLETRVLEPRPEPPKIPPRQNDLESIAEVVPNGVGRIQPASPPDPPEPRESEPEVVHVKILERIKVSFPPASIEKYVRERLGTGDELSDEQFSRGTVAMRNEITKELLGLLRGYRDLEFGSDPVTVSLLPPPPTAPDAQSIQLTAWQSKLVLPSLAGIGLVVASVLMFSNRKSRAGGQQATSGHVSNDSTSGRGRALNLRIPGTRRREASQPGDAVTTDTGDSIPMFGGSPPGGGK